MTGATRIRLGMTLALLAAGCATTQEVAVEQLRVVLPVHGSGALREAGADGRAEPLLERRARTSRVFFRYVDAGAQWTQYKR